MITLAIALTVLQALDGWTTYKIIRRGGSENNPVVAKLIGALGLYPALVLLKGGAAALIWLLVLLPDPKTEAIRYVLLAALTVVYLWVAWHNWKVYRK